MKNIKKIIAFFFIICSFQSCGTYSFTGADIDYSTIKTFQVNYFKNNAPIVEPGIDRDFTLKLQDILLNQTSLDLVNSSGDLNF